MGRFKASVLLMLVMTSHLLQHCASKNNVNSNFEDRNMQLLSPLEQTFANLSAPESPAKYRLPASATSRANEDIVIAISFRSSGTSAKTVMQWKPEVPVLSDITIQFWFRLQHSSPGVNVFMNYFKENDEICLYHDKENKEVILDAQAYKLSVKVDIPTHTWTHFLVTFGLVSTKYYVQVNGQLLASKLEVNNNTDARKAVAGGGVLLLGQKQGSRDRISSLDMAEFCIFPVLLSDSTDVLDCSDDGDGRVSAIVTTNRISDWVIQGDIRIFSITRLQLYRNLERSDSSFLENQQSDDNLCAIFGLSTEDTSVAKKNNLGKATISPDFKCLPSHNTIKIYGLCKVSQLDRVLYIQGISNRKPEFLGIYTKLWWDNATWVLTSRLSPNIEAKMIQSNPDDPPLGRHRWYISGDRCPAHEVDLLLTVCGEESFPCDDGTCVDMSQRCDLRAHCEDGSDEMGCDKVFIGAFYEKTLPPPPPETDGVLNVTFSLVTHAVHDLDLLAQTVRLDVLLISQWEDARLQYADLHPEPFRNEVNDPDRVWMPRLIVADDTGSRVRIDTRGLSLMVLRGSDPLARDNTRAVKGIVYPGKGNVLSLRQELSISFQCQFDLRWFPFDNQRCSINLRFSEMESKLLRMLGTKAKYLGQKKLHEYKVEYIDMIKGKHENEQRITMCLTNLFVYYLVNSYLPSFLLVIISYSTFYFPLEGFNERIMANITAMLVLVSLFQQPCSTILKTTYLKLIDVWYMICIVVDFIMVILLVIIDYIRNIGENMSKVFPVSAGVKPLFDLENNAWKYNTIAKVMLPLLFLILFGAYGITSAIQYATG